LSHYDEALNELKHKAQKLAKECIVELYTILRGEEKLPPEDCRARIERDCLDIRSKATIKKYLPEEAKDSKKQKAVKIANEIKKKKKVAALLMTQSTDGAGINLTEGDSFNQNEEGLSSFQNEPIPRLMTDSDPNSELWKVKKLIAEKSTRIIELETQIKEMSNQNQNIASPSLANEVLLLPDKIAREIFHLIRETGINYTTMFKLRHNGHEVTAII
jgi:hypothetical protein